MFSSVKFRSPLLAALLLASLAGMARASADSTCYFYRGLDYGSQANTHPFQIVLNSTFGIMQIANRSNVLADVDYANGYDVLMHNLGHPIASIEHEGWGNFVRKEILPFATGLSDARYWPNYTQHLIGGGMTYRMMREWYRLHGYRHERSWALGTIFFYHYCNEIVECSWLEGYTTDPIADLYFFDPLSCLLFESDRVSRFFGETLGMMDWSYQPAYDPGRGTLENNGQNFAFRWQPSSWDRWSLFYYFGAHGEGGLSYRRADGTNWSFAMGFKASELLEMGPGTLGADLAAVGGIFVDREGSLLASLLIAATKDYAVRLNVYPGVLRIGPVSPSFFVAVDRDERVVAGLNVGWPRWQPMGLAASF